MLTKHEAEVLQQSMHRELEARPGAVYKCAAGILLVLVLSIVGLESPQAAQVFASADILEQLMGIAR